MVTNTTYYDYLTQPGCFHLISHLLHVSCQSVSLKVIFIFAVAVNGFPQGFAASPSQVSSRGYGTGSSPGPLDIYGSTTTQGDQNGLSGTGGYIQATSPQPSSYGIGAQVNTQKRKLFIF